MRRFVLLDPSLARIHGHFHEYALQIALAAEAAGLQPLLAVHRECPVSGLFPDHWTVRPTFRVGALSHQRIWWDRGRYPFAVNAWGDRQALPNTPGEPGSRWSWLRSLADWPNRRLRNYRLTSLVQDCGQFFQQIGLRTDDVVFFPALTPLHALAVARFVSRLRAGMTLDWHLQFHLPVLRGRPEQWPEQTAARELERAQLAEAIGRAGNHRLRFYATTESLAAQFTSLGVAPCHHLPYPVNQSLGLDIPTTASPTRAPLRVTFAGELRKDKGHRELAELIRASRQQLLDSQHVRFVIQGSAGRLRRWLPEVDESSNPTGPALECVPYPLPSDQYLRLIREADVGVFLYDAETYAVRCSGVVSEMLAAGVPLIVPDQSWLADQVRAADQPVGLIASSRKEVPRLLAELIRNYDQFRQAARNHAPRWRREHHPARTVEILLESSATSQQRQAA